MEGDSVVEEIEQEENVLMEGEEEELQLLFCRFENNKLLIDLLVHLTLDTYKDYECFVEATPEVKLITLLDCLRLFGINDSITTTISYSSEESLLKISLEESGILTICEVSCLFVEDLDELQQGLILAFRNTEEECQLILKSEALRDSLNDIIDSTWNDSVDIEVNSFPQYLKITAAGSLGFSEVLIPRASDAYISFNCLHPISAPYNLKSLTLGMKALSLGKETFLRINAEGILCLQHQIETMKEASIFYDFLLLPEERLKE